MDSSLNNPTRMKEEMDKWVKVRYEEGKAQLYKYITTPKYDEKREIARQRAQATRLIGTFLQVPF
jgi:hypothetical protein